MNARQEKIFRYIIEDYIINAQPIGSKYLAEKYDLDTSSATIRNDMSKLEVDELIYQPHTSAGRLPTEKGINYYLSHLMKPQPISVDFLNLMDRVYRKGGLKELAKQAAAYSRAAVILAFGKHDLYYTGFTYLFAKPEFSDNHMLQSIAKAVDQIESSLPIFFRHRVNIEPRVYLGSSNPIGNDCSAIFIGNPKNKTLFGMLNPIRTNYPKHVGLLQNIANYL